MSMWQYLYVYMCVCVSTHLVVCLSNSASYNMSIQIYAVMYVSTTLFMKSCVFSPKDVHQSIDLLLYVYIYIVPNHIWFLQQV